MNSDGSGTRIDDNYYARGDDNHARCRARTVAAVQIAREYGQTDGDHHKAWVIDQMIRALLDQDYDAWVERYCHGEDGAATYRWETGIAP